MNKNDQLKHLEMIQSIINRLAGNSFFIKGWTITISLAGFGFFTNNNQDMFLIFTAFAAIIFWILDAYYLGRERLFRRLYENVANIQTRKKKLTEKTLSMDVSKYSKGASDLLSSVLSFPTMFIYVAILSMAAILYYSHL